MSDALKINEEYFESFGYSKSIQEDAQLAYLERLEKECYAAWRSEYDYLHVHHPPGTVMPEFVPSNYQRISGLDYFVTVYTVADSELSALAQQKLREYEP
jgi:hypothetical protein